MRDLGIVKDGAVAIRGGRIVAVGRTRDLRRRFVAGRTRSCRGRCVTPGLVDPHTHPVSLSPRSDEFAARLEGRSYQEISAAGGGIRRTVREVRAGLRGGSAALREAVAGRLARFVEHGTTTVEAKSGYGLTTASEVRQLELIRELAAARGGLLGGCVASSNPPRSRTIADLRHGANAQWRKRAIGGRGLLLPRLVGTFLGAHEIPPEFAGRPRAYVDLLCDEMIPAVAARGLARFCDVFCEKGVFEIEDSRRILLAAKRAGFRLKVHADEFAPLGGAELAAEVGAVSADHLMAVSDRGIRALRQAGVVPVLLPSTTFGLGLRSFAPARKMIEAGLPVALATDCNPGTSPSESMPFAMSLACTQLRLTPAEALTAATQNAAAALALAHEIGSLAPGKRADLVIWKVDDPRAIPFHAGVNLVEGVILNGLPSSASPNSAGNPQIRS
ncbi:MAG: imidazolonepropionase [Planctomycetes bacterium]|nr:imidazolonepropionase [Planctomycetota bacterium]